MDAGTLASQRALFDLPPDVTYLNCAYMSPQLRAATEAGHAAMARKAHPWEITAPDFFSGIEALRALAAPLFGCRADDVALVPSASYGLSTAAAHLGLTPASRVVALADQFPSNVYPWQATGARVDFVARPEAGGWADAVLAALDEPADVVALPQVHWTDGSPVDLPPIAQRARDMGAAIVLDVTQSLGVVPLGLDAADVDYAVAAAYKWLLGPYSLGYFYVNPRRQDGPPLEYGWMGREGSEDFAGLVRYTDRYQPGARRFDVGEVANFALVPVARAALEQIAEWSVPRIAASVAVLTDALADAAASAGFRVADKGNRSPHLLGVDLGDVDVARLEASLSAERVYVSRRGDRLRISPHLYNGPEDVEAFHRALDRARG